MIKVFKRVRGVVGFAGEVVSFVEEYKAAQAAKVIIEVESNLAALDAQALETTLVVKKEKKAARSRDLKSLRENKHALRAYNGRSTSHSHKTINRTGSLRFASKMDILASGAFWFEKAAEGIPRKGYLSAFAG